MGALISYTNLADSGTLTNSSDGSNVLPVTNLQTRQLGRVFRQTLSAASPLQSVIVDADLGSAKDIKYVGIFGHNISAGSYAVALGTSSGGSQVASESGTLWQGVADDPKQQHVIFSQTYSARYVRVTLTPDAGQTVDWGRLWIDDPWMPKVGLKFRPMIMDPSQKERSLGQSVFAYRRPRYRVNRMHFVDLSEQEALGSSSDSTIKSAHHMDMTVGTSDSVVVIPETTGTDSEQVRHKLGIYGVIKRSTEMRLIPVKESSGWHYQKDLEVEEER